MLSLQELRSLSVKDLLAELDAARKELMKLRLGVRTKNVKDSSQVRKQRRFIASIQTQLKDLELEEKAKKAATL